MRDRNYFKNRMLIFMAMVLGFVTIWFETPENTYAGNASSDWKWPTYIQSIKSDWPRYSSGSYHSGTDFPVPLNTPVYATCDGEVVSVQSLTTSYGKHIKIKATVNGSTVYIRYCHLNSFAVSNGDRVHAGQLIAYSGSTGNSTGPHLHYEVRNANDYYGNASSPTLNPRNYLPGSSYTYDTETSAPINSQIRLDKQVYGLEHYIDMKLSSDGGADYYTVQIWNGNKLICSRKVWGDSIRIPCNQLGAGTFGVYTTAYNDYGYCTSSTVAFRIAERLSNPHIYLNKDKFELSDKMEFTATVDGGADYYGLQIWKGGTVVFQKSFTGHTINVPCEELGLGDYGAFVSCVNQSGNIVSEVIHFRIGSEPYNPRISINSDNMNISDTIKFTAEADGGVDYYGLQIWKGGTVVFQESFTGHEINVPCNRLGEGQYGAFVSCVNSLGSITTDTVSFKIGVREEPEIYKLSSFIWSSDLRTCSAEFVSQDNKDKQILDCMVTDSIVKEADCMTPGLKMHIATVCFGDKDYIDMRSETIHKKDHAYGDWITTKKTTCTVSGTKEYVCSNCGDSYTEPIPATGHTWDAGKVTLKATASTEGILTYTCLSCGETKTESIPATGQMGDDNPDDKDAPDNKDNPDKDDIDADEDEKDSDKEEIPDTNDEESNSPEIGDVAEDAGSGDEYEIISVDGNVICVEYVESANPRATVIKIPATIKTEDGTVCKVTSISKCAFKNNRRLKKVVMGSNVTAIGTKAFSGCKNLTSVTIGKNVVSIGAGAFSNCTKLTSLTIPSKVTKIGSNAFSGCKKLKKLEIKSRKLNAKGLNKRAFKGISTKVLVQVPKDKRTVYQKLLCQKGLSKRNKIK